MTARQTVAEALAGPARDPAESANLERRDWAGEVLGVRAETEPRAARAAFARQLQQAEFVPPDAWRAAYETLSGQPAVFWPALGHEAYLIDREPRLRGEVESLAREFFELPVVQRADRYRRLHARLQDFPQLRARLESLEIGLPVERLELLDSKPWVHELASSACRLFVLRPLPRAIARQQMLPHFAPEISQWQLTARVLQQHYPQVAALAPELIDELLDWHARRQRIAKRQKAAAKPVGGSASKHTMAHGTRVWIYVVGCALIWGVGSILQRPDPPAPKNPPSLPAADRDAFEESRQARQRKEESEAKAEWISARIQSELESRERKREQGLDPRPISADMQKIIRDSERHSQETDAPANAPAEKEPASMP